MEQPTVERIASTVARGVAWLHQRAETLDDARGMAVTVLALAASERNQHSHAIQRLVRELQRIQRRNGSWNDELWDTAWAAQALRAAGISPGDGSIQNALAFCSIVQDKQDGTWYGEPWETLLVLELYLGVDLPRLEREGQKAIEWIGSLQRPDGLVVGPRYTGMAVNLFLNLSQKGARCDPLVSVKGLECLRSILSEREIWADAAWSNSYPLRALLDSGMGLKDSAVAKAVGWFLRTQQSDGRWDQVSEIHDTAMAVMVLSSLLTAPIVLPEAPRLGVLSVNREDGTIRVSYQDPRTGAVALAEKMKLSAEVRSELGENQQLLLGLAERLRSPVPPLVTQRRGSGAEEELLQLGNYSFGHLIPLGVKTALLQSSADHLRLDVDEELIDLPWELLHDDDGYLCLGFAVGRRIISGNAPPEISRSPTAPSETKALVVADPTKDLPAAREEGRRVSQVLSSRGLDVSFYYGDQLSKKEFLLALSEADLLHFAGHAQFDRSHPDESYLSLCDGKAHAFEIQRFLNSGAPSLVFLNACWSGEEARGAEAMSPMVRSLSRTFMFAGAAAFLGYVVPIPDTTATELAVDFYSGVALGLTIGESLRQARARGKLRSPGSDLTWASALLYGDPTLRLVDRSRGNSLVSPETSG